MRASGSANHLLAGDRSFTHWQVSFHKSEINVLLFATMKTLAFTSILAAFALASEPTLSTAQTNTFPSSGNVGIGTTAPAMPLEVAGVIRTSGTNPTFSIYGSGQAQVQWTNCGDPFDQQITELIGQGSALTGRFVNSAYTSASNWLYVTRNTGSYTVRSVNFPNGNVGIGTTNPGVTLDVIGNIAVEGWENQFFARDSFTPSGYRHVIGGAHGWDPNMLYINGFKDFTSGVEVGGSGNSSNLYVNGNVGIGTTNPTYPLTVNGTIEAKEVIVQTGWSDYVFSPTYRLAPLSEVEQQIKAEKHLPGLPSAQQVAAHGISLGDMQAKLLAKIEELTLHLISQEKQLNAQASRLEKLEHENAILRNHRSPSP